MVINHEEALDLAYIKREESNLARAYIELRTLAIAVLEAREREARAAADKNLRAAVTPNVTSDRLAEDKQEIGK